MMKRWLVLAACCASSALLAAPGPQDFAWRAPINAAPDTAWVRMEVPPQAQAQLQTADARDLQVFNAEGQSLPLYMADKPVDAAVVVMQPTAWFKAMPLQTATHPATANAPVSIHVQQADTNVQVQVGHGSAGAATSESHSVVFDLRKLDTRLSGLQLQATLPTNQPVDMVVEVSTNLRDWQRLDAQATVYQFAGEGAADVQQLRIVWDTPWASKGYFLKLQWPQTVQGVAVQAAQGLKTTSSPAPELREWPLPAPTLEQDGALVWAALPPALRLEQLRLQLTPSGNQYHPVTISARVASNAPWQTLAYDMLWRTEATATQAARSNGASTVSGTWQALRLQSRNQQPLPATGITAVAALRPREAIFLRSGSAPFTLVAGRTMRHDDPAPVRLQQGELATMLPDWKKLPYTAVGAAAITPITPPTGLHAAVAHVQQDQRQLWLWAVLLIGVAVLGGVAYRLYSQTRNTE